ncbi:maleate cis-trans isomerase family protein [Streptosporangium carneum]|uniref:Maleate isomerase n=1 Tax=Streptosporangium carneum TaxID=47481 RepID=A0A9W6MDA9_9ACTN|nr:aspartate/glutamate racemase family protein [Streptosporangium carneum]GLK09598.1 maleate isomerase [Streptosporangium carneum]
MSAHRVGLIVPSSNITMETEIPELLRRRTALHPEDVFTVHGSRMRMRRVTAEELRRMDAEADRCVTELADARCDVYAYACLVAIMAAGPGYHDAAERRLTGVAADAGGPAPVVSSAGALLAGLDVLGARTVAMVTPYLPELTDLVRGYLEGHGVTVRDALSLGVADNLAVGCLDPASLLDHYRRLDLSGCDALVLSACVQMPSLQVIQRVEDEVGIPVLSAATATAHALLTSLGLAPVVPEAGALLAGCG